MRRQIVYIIAAVAVCACSKLLPEEIDVVQMGIVQENVVAECNECSVGAKVISDRDYALSVNGEAPWMKIVEATRDTIVFRLDENEAFCRSVYVNISANGRVDSVQVRQKGKWKESIALSETFVEAPVEGTPISVRVMSNLPSDYLVATTLDDKAIGNISIKDYILTFDVLPTHNRDKKTYNVTVSYVDGWGETVSAKITVIQEAYE